MMRFDPRSEVGRSYLDYVENRARIWAEKYIDGREPDYHGDEVLRRYHFCNVWRELDRYSRWEIAQIRGKPLRRQLDLIIVGRLTMVPATIKLLLADATADDIRRYAAARRAIGLPWFNPALQIRCRSGADYAEMFVSHRDAYFTRRDCILKTVKNAESAADVANSFVGTMPLIGPFRAYEITTSLTYSDRLPALREEQLFHVGPGAIGGLEMLTGHRTTDCATFEVMRVIVKSALLHRKKFRWIPKIWQAYEVKAEQYKFTLRTLEDSLCEFRKYIAMSGGGGVATRRHYHKRDITL